MTEKIEQMMSQMTDAEIRERLAEYMERDVTLRPPLIAVEVRMKPTYDASCRYDVLLIDEEGGETPVQFHDRYSRLLYIFTLLNPKGFQRRQASANHYSALCHLYSQLYFRDSDALLRTIDSTVTQARRAIREASPLAEQFAIDRPQSNNGRLLIPFVSQGGTVIIDASLLHNNMYNV